MVAVPHTLRVVVDEIGGGLEVGTGRGNDVWGWTDPKTCCEYVIAGRENGTTIVDITNRRSVTATRAG